MSRHRFLASILLVAACSQSKKAGPPGLAFELPFERSFDPEYATGLAHEFPVMGIAYVNGVEGSAAEFDGSGAALKFRGIDALQIHDAMTLEFFVKPADWINPYGAGSGLESFVSHSDVFTVGVSPRSWGLEARLTTSASEKSLHLAGGTVRPGAWHHVALVYDGKQVRLVLDGDIVAETAATGAVPVQHDLELVVGTWFQKNQAFCGGLDSIRIWNRALSADELRARVAPKS